MAIKTGSCHCGHVRFEVDVEEPLTVYECNCSICRKAGFLHLIVPESKFRLVEGDDYLTTYTFNTHVAKHLFCIVCGVKAYYIPRSNPDGVDVNLRCLDDVDVSDVTIAAFDGQNWEANADSLADLSSDG